MFYFILLLDTIVAFWYFPLVFFCLFFLCETVTYTAVLTLLLSLYGSLALLLFPVSHFISFTCFVPGHWVLCHQIPTNPLFISLSHCSLWVRFWSLSIYPPLSPPIMLSARSLQELRCAISVSMCPPDVLRILFLQLLFCGVLEQLVLNILPFFTFIPLLTLAFVCSLFTLLMVVLCLVLLLDAFPAIHRTTWPTLLPHKQKHILLVLPMSCQQAL